VTGLELFFKRSGRLRGSTPVKQLISEKEVRTMRLHRVFVWLYRWFCSCLPGRAADDRQNRRAGDLELRSVLIRDWSNDRWRIAASSGDWTRRATWYH
jgi:hypothetical protein